MTSGGMAKYGGEVPISDEMAHNSGLCTCPGGVCTYRSRPLPPPPPWPTRVFYFLRRRWWGLKRLPGYRLIHKDDLYDPSDY